MTTDALIIRENNNIGESDRFVTALTREFGVIRASAKGARNIKNRNLAATQLLSYSRLSLHRGRDKYIIQDAKPITVFFELRGEIEKLALAQYFCDLTAVLAPQEEPAEDFLRLMLNSLHFLAQGSREPKLIKAVLELRMLSLAGFMPDLSACALCGALNSDTMLLLPSEGRIVCRKCVNDRQSSGGLVLSPDGLAAMRHIIYSEFEKCFSFKMSETGLESLSRCAEVYMLSQLGRGFKTLDFYNTISSQFAGGRNENSKPTLDE
ncbi:MAG TPA: DNA repair protein RecO [Candidatus Avimonas sp.]|jgi:DNA repair protein RecO (recombination protein O)|nr:DNA repair protein RecO [Candidatus Avimonas sp.]